MGHMEFHHSDCDGKIDELLQQMTLEEKVWLCHGCSSMEAGGIPRLEIGKIAMADGPQGVRLEDGRTSTALPSGISLACTWDSDAAYQYGALLGREVIASGSHVSLGPGLNLMRTPLNGRNFEYFGEDPVLAGKIAADYIRGCQSERAAATPKHLALNNQEICRTTGDSRVDERTLRELYLTGFEILTKEAHPWMMMSSYNKINGEQASACRLTQQQIVKDEWGFDGVMVSDWGGAHDAKSCALGGLDMEMGQGADSVMGKPLLELVKNGEVPETVIDDKVRRVLRLLFRLGLFDAPDQRPRGEINTARHHKLAKKLAQQGMVLLKNQDQFLPLNAKKIKTLAVIGPNADFAHSMGPLEACGGSGAVHPAYEITPLAGLKKYCAAKKIKVLYAPGVQFVTESVIPAALLRYDRKTSGLKAEYFHQPSEIALGQPYLTVFDTKMDLRWSKTAQVAGTVAADLPDRDFAVRWTGILTPDRSGKVRLSLAALHGYAKIWLDGQEVLATDPALRLHQNGYEFKARSGKDYTFRLEFVCTAAEPALKLLWQTDAGDSRQAALDAAAQADAVVFCGGTNHSYDKEAIGWGDVPNADIPDLELIGPQAELIRALVKVNPNLAVVLNNGSVVDTESWIDAVPALLEAWYAGMESGNALAEVLFGDFAPEGRLCCTWGKKLTDYACHANGNYPGVRTGDHPYVNYDEGMFIGYRHFDRAGIEPRFPFGFGLSYTQFKVRLIDCWFADVTTASPHLKVGLRVTNTGSRAGAETVQLYVGDNECSVERPVKELKAFQKVRLLPGQSIQTELDLSWRDFAFWSPDKREWTVEPGTFTLYLGTSAQDIVARIPIRLY